MRLQLLGVLAVGAAACSPSGTPDTDDVVDTEPLTLTCLKAEPGLLDFGSVFVGVDPAVTRSLRLVNQCSYDVRLDGLVLDGASEGLRVGAPGSKFIPDGGNTEVAITFDPVQVGVIEGAIEVLWGPVEQLGQASLTVPLTGSGDGVSVELELSADGFSGVWIGCTATLDLVIRNRGTLDLEVTEIVPYASTNEFSFVADGLPWTLPPGGERVVQVLYAPRDGFPDSLYLVVHTSDPYEPEAVVSLDATGGSFGQGTDSFVAAHAGPTDVLLTLDRSTLADLDVLGFAEALDQLSDDWHLAIATADAGCIAGGKAFVSEPDADAIAKMADADGAPGVSTREGFELALAALANTHRGGCNHGLLRSGAFLSVVHASMVDEQGADSPASYVTALGAISNPETVRVGAYAGPVDGSCTRAEAADRYADAIDRTGGWLAPVCFTDALATLARASLPLQQRFVPAAPAAPISLQARIDGIRTRDWTWEEGAVTFAPQVAPAPGAQVELSYDLMPDECP